MDINDSGDYRDCPVYQFYAVKEDDMLAHEKLESISIIRACGL